MQSIYISGKITGLDPRVARELFDQAEAKLREMGYQPINPMALVQEHPEKKWEDYMLEDFALLLPADGICMLENWKDSKGARIELYIATEMEKKVLMFNSPTQSVEWRMVATERSFIGKERITWTSPERI